MDAMVDSLRSAIGAQAYYPALAMALALPDICGRVETPEETSRIRYRRWWDENMLERYPHSLCGDDAYALRCAYLHEGQHDIAEQRARSAVDRFQFIVSPKGITIHCNYAMPGNLLQLDVGIFCGDVADRVSAWVAQRSEQGASTAPDRFLQIQVGSWSFSG